LIGHCIGCATVSLSRRSVQIRSRGLALVWCCVRRNIITGNRTFSGHTTHVFIMCSLHLFCTYSLMVKTIRLLASSKSSESSPPKEGGYWCICRRAAGSLVLLASRERVHVSHWLPLLGMFFHPCRCWYGILAAGCQFVAQCPSVCRGEW
jgi:hypothetical protein